MMNEKEEPEKNDDESPDDRSKVVLILACIVMALIYLVPIIVGVALSFSPHLNFFP